MLKKPITYTDYNGAVRTEDFYFNLTKTELAKLELGKAGGMQTYLQQIIETGDGQQIMDAMELFIGKSYGVKSADGRTFLKNDQILAEFQASAAYDVLFYEMVTDADAGAKFCVGIMPADLGEAVMASMGTKNPSVDVQAQHLAAVPDFFQGQPVPGPLSAEEFGLKGESPQVMSVDEVMSFDDAPKTDKNISKENLVKRQMIRQGKAIVIHRDLLDLLTPAELDKALENGCQLA